MLFDLIVTVNIDTVGIAHPKFDSELEYEIDSDGVGSWRLEKFVCCTSGKPYLI